MNRILTLHCYWIFSLSVVTAQSDPDLLIPANADILYRGINDARFFKENQLVITGNWNLHLPGYADNRLLSNISSLKHGINWRAGIGLKHYAGTQELMLGSVLVKQWGKGYIAGLSLNLHQEDNGAYYDKQHAYSGSACFGFPLFKGLHVTSNWHWIRFNNTLVSRYTVQADLKWSEQVLFGCLGSFLDQDLNVGLLVQYRFTPEVIMNVSLQQANRLGVGGQFQTGSFTFRLDLFYGHVLGFTPNHAVGYAW